MEYLVLGSKCLLSAIAAFLGYRIYLDFNSFDVDKVLSKRTGYFSSDRVDKLLRQTGNHYNLTVKKYFLYKILLACLFFGIGCLILNYLVGIVLSVIGFFFLDRAIDSYNKQENRLMLNDLSSLLECVRLQMIAGIQINNLFKECYKTVRLPRLKRSLKELSASLVTAKGVEDSLDEFNSKFKNKYINSFCIALKQSYSSGSGEKSLSSLISLVDTIENELNKEQARKIDNFCSVCMIVVFLVAIGILFVTMGTEALKAFNNI